MLTRLESFCGQWARTHPLRVQKSTKNHHFLVPKPPSSQPNEWPKNPRFLAIYSNLADFDRIWPKLPFMAQNSGVFYWFLLEIRQKKPLLDLVVLARFRPISVQTRCARFQTRFSVRTILPYIQGVRKVDIMKRIYDRPIQPGPKIGAMDGVSGPEFPVRVQKVSPSGCQMCQKWRFLVIFSGFSAKTGRKSAGFGLNGVRRSKKWLKIAQKWPFWSFLAGLATFSLKPAGFGPVLPRMSKKPLKIVKF